MVNVKDVDRMRREMQAIEDDIANAEKGKAALEDKVWEVEAKLVTKLEELERHADQCNQALKKLKPTVAFQYMIDSKGSSPAEMLGMDFHELIEIPHDNRRRYHDDVSVIVISFEGRIWRSCV
ncbi:hypothetical protein ZEAMMB73_Zm00001d016122 [Zea mays]|uniref:protein-serine/threonine phosphatase n=1 Tax=Zea mays TaxID=4577 RepID=A0A1D6H5I8_MAIZE|nr:hypothetical protein ZEAMMB73_Zm00001d016122 [Zea mays]AQK70086.1 hypothetical protein ZEAMMB73_Zm00001d016122 [Zea mays]AQK70087.1 hypothetical protein ZEAMMB73_Zm00001d016122 [Zea mays]